MGEWREVQIDEITIYVNRGIAPKYADANGIIVINQKCIRNGKIDYSLSRLHDQKKKSQTEKYLQKNDILINSTGVGTAGRVALFNNDFDAIPDSHISILRLNQKLVYPEFIFYNLRDREKELEETSEGSTGQIELKRDAIKILEINLPPLPEQKAIARVLSSLDDKIDLLHRQNKTLEQMAETLFRQWFVKEAQEDWEEGTISHLIDFNPKRSLKKDSIAPYVEMASLSNTTFSPSNWYDREFSSGSKFVNKDTLLARITPCLENGKTAYITFLEDEQVAWGSTEYIVMRPKFNIHPLFAYILARYEDFRDYAEACLEGSSGRQRVNIDHLKSYPIQIPDNNIIAGFNTIAASIEAKLHLNFFQIRTLEKLRNTLLPKLMSGEVRVAVDE